MVVTRIKELLSTSNMENNGKVRHLPTCEESTKSESCNVCRFVGGGGLTALGIYVLAFANGFTSKPSRRIFTHEAGPRNAAANVLGCFILALGVARMLDFQLPATPSNPE